MLRAKSQHCPQGFESFSCYPGSLPPAATCKTRKIEKQEDGETKKYDKGKGSATQTPLPPGALI